MATPWYDSEEYSTDYNAFTVLCDIASDTLQFRSWFMPLAYTVIFLLGLAGNFLVIFTFLYFRRLKTMTDVYLLNLAIADLLFTLSLPFWAANFMSEWVLGLFMCKAMYSMHKITFYSSIFLLSCISVDRYFAITKAVTAHRHRAKTALLGKVTVGVIWALALIFSAPEMNNTLVHHGTCTPFWSANSSNDLQIAIQSTQIALGFFIPLLVMAFCYSAIVIKLHQSRNFERNRALKVILAVVMVFLLCQVPYTVVLFLNTLHVANGRNLDCHWQRVLTFATDATQFLAVFRCCLNPLVYAFIGVKFRQDLLKLLREMGCLSQKSFFKYSNHSGRKGSVADTETTTTFSP